MAAKGKGGSKDFMKMLSAFDDAVSYENNPHENVVRITRSPSVGFTFGNGHGLPCGYSLLLYGPKDGGKSLICNDSIGTVHQDYEDGWALKFNTEMREELQLSPRDMENLYGIDISRYKCFETNKADDVFDRIDHDIAAMCDAGMNLKLIVIDSISDILGRRLAEADSINNVQIGDQAMTLQLGFQRILSTIRRHRIAMILVAHQRAEMDPVLVRQHQTVKPAAAHAVRHFAEYFGQVSRDDSADGKKDLLDNELRNDELQDVRLDKGEFTGHKVKFLMKENKCGVRGRQGLFTFDYRKGITNVHEEVFLLGMARGIIQRPNNATYVFGEQRWNGKPALLGDLASNQTLCQDILKELKRRDQAGEWASEGASLAPALVD